MGGCASSNALLASLAITLAAPASAAPAKPDVRHALTGLHVPFEANVGQYDARVAYAARTFAGTTFVTRDGELVHALADASGKRGWSLVETLVGARVTARGAGAAAGGVSRFTFDQADRRRLDVPTWRSVSLGEAWDGIEVTVEARGANVEKIFTVAPGADAARIRVAVGGAESLSVDVDGTLVATTAVGPVRFTAPIAWQYVRGKRRDVAVRYVVNAAQYGFRLGDHDPGSAVTIDPLLHSTYLNGGAFDTPNAIGVDAAGNVFVAGPTTSFGFPGTAGGAQPSPNGFDSWIAKLSGDLQTLIQATYIGGMSNEDLRGLALDTTGNVYVAGRTQSTNFPATTGGVQATSGGGSGDGFVAKLTNDLRTFIQATYLGGEGDDGVTAIALAANGDVVVAGQTRSANLPGGATPANGADGFAARLTGDLRTLVRSIVFGGGGTDSAESVAVGPDGSVYAAGSTDSANFPGVTGGAQSLYAGGLSDGFVVRLAPDLSALTQATYLGGTNQDSAHAVAADAAGNVFVAGRTRSTELPGTANGAQPTLSSQNGAFVARLPASLGAIAQSTYLGFQPYEDALALAVDNAGHVYVGGASGQGPFQSAPSVHKLPDTLAVLRETLVMTGLGQFATALKLAGGNFYLAAAAGPDAFIATGVLNAPAPGPPTQIVLSGPTNAAAGQTHSFSVRMLDAAGTLVLGRRVRFTSSDGAATLPAETLLNNPGGATLTATFRTLGSQTITATDTTDTALTGTSPSILVRSGPAARFTVSAPATVISGVPFDYIVTALDQFGNTATTYLGRTRFTSTDSAATLPSHNTLVQGVRSFRATLRTVGNRTITAIDTQQTSITGTSGTIAVQERILLELGAPSNATAGTPFPMTVTARTGSGAPATGYSGTVHFASSDAAAVLPPDTPITNGAGTVNVTLKTAGSQTVSAADTAVASTTGTSNAIAVASAAVSSFEVVTPPSAVPGTAFPFGVNARDAFGNLASYAGTVRFTSTDGGATLPPDAALASGAGSFNATLATLGNQTITATDAANGALNGTSPAISVSMIAPSPTSLDFGGQSMGTTSPARSVTFTNTGAAAITIASVTFSNPQFAAASHDCATLAPSASCTVQVTFTPAATPGPVGTSVAVAGTVMIAPAAGGGAGIALAGRGERSLVVHYYRSILRRAPDSGGMSYWEGEAARVAALGANVNEVWFAMAMQFFFSPEYFAQARDNDGYVTDVYRTFFNRGPDATGRDFWMQNLAQGMPREVLLAEFMFSTEFRNFAQAIFGNTAARAEVDMIMDFYRGLLARLPDNAGFAYWLARFRNAQCDGVPHSQTSVMSSEFTSSPEYKQRARTNAQYVGDLYNAFLRRGGDLQGVQFWIGALDAGTRSREGVRSEFLQSPEFQARTQAVADAGCAN